MYCNKYLKFTKRVDLILSILNTHIHNIKRVGGNFGGDGYVYGPDDGDGFISVYLSQA